MRNQLVAACAAVALCVLGRPALADGPRAHPPPNWNGFYIGGYVGGAWGDADIRTDAGELTATSYFVSAENINSINRNSSGSLSPDAAIGGGQVGFNVQHGRLVAGLEVDFGTFDLSGARGATNVPYPSLPTNTYTARASMDSEWLLTARGRLGWTLQPNLLIYATGGLALTNLRVSNSFNDNSDTAGIGGGSNTETMVGWTLGGGAELLLAGHWSVKAEYLYVDFGSMTARSSIVCGPTATFDCGSVPVTPNAFSTSADLSAHIARVGLNYKF